VANEATTVSPVIAKTVKVIGSAMVGFVVNAIRATTTRQAVINFSILCLLPFFGLPCLFHQFLGTIVLISPNSCLIDSPVATMLCSIQEPTFPD
jgi:hypothetical protein